jgi:hypothetical protein
MHETFASGISDIPIPDMPMRLSLYPFAVKSGPCDLYPVTVLKCSRRGFGVRSFKVYESLVTEVPDFPMNFQHRWAHSLSGLSPMVQISATCPLNERSRFRCEIVDRDSVEQDLYALKNSNSPISDSAESPDMCPPWNSTAMIPPRVFENHRVLILLSSNILTPLRDFSSTHEDLSPAQLLSTRTVDG